MYNQITMARKERIMKNGLAGILKYAVKLILQFVLRTIVIYKLGVEYVGLDSLYANIISMLSLAELGIGSAIVFCMYKPAAEHDVEKLKSLNNLYKKLYLVISLIVLVVGIGISPFLKHFIKGNPNVDVNLHVIYFIFLANTVISYLGAHKKSLLYAHQRFDIENNVMSAVLLTMSIAQIIFLLIFENYYLYAMMTPLFTLFDVIIVVVIAKKLYPEIRGKAQPLDKETKSIVTKNIVGASLHQIGGVIVMSTDNLLISIFFGLTVLGRVSNYILIFNAITQLMIILGDSIQASVGNMVATSEKEKVYKTYQMLNWIFACVIGFCSVCMICLYQHFIRMWVGAQYLIGIWVVLAIVVRFYTTRMRSVTCMFKNCAGLMWNDRLKPIFEMLVNIIASIICIKLIGVAGVFVGTVISTVVVPLWVEPLVLHKHYFKSGLKTYFFKYFLFASVTAVAGVLAYFVCSLLPIYGIWWFILKCVICFATTAVVYLLAYFKTSEFKNGLSMIRNIFKKRNKKLNNEKIEK